MTLPLPLRHLATLLVAVVVLCGLSPAARADRFEWVGPVSEGHIVLFEVIEQPPDGGEERLAIRLYGKDGQNRARAGWLLDFDERPDTARFELPDLWLAPSRYVLRTTVGGETTERPLETRDRPPNMVAVELPAGATGVWAMRQGGDSHDGFAYAPAIGTAAFLPLGTGEWSAHVLGPPAGLYGDRRIESGTSATSFHMDTDGYDVGERGPSSRLALLLSVGLAGLLGLGGAVAAGRCFTRLRGWQGALAVGLALAAFAISPALGQLGTSVPFGDAGLTDPANSAAQFEALANSLPRFSDVSDAYSWPEGGSLLILGSSWLAYLPLVPVALVWNGLAAHNLGMFLWLAVLFCASWALARAVGAGPISAAVAGVGTVMAPIVWGELDALSLDRMSLATVPVFLLCLEMAARKPGWRWPVAGGVALALVFYGQVYYGLYLAVACPVLVLWRLVGPAPHKRLARLALVGVVAGGLLVPGLWVLKQGTEQTTFSGTEKDFRTLVEESGRALADPIDSAEVLKAIEAPERLQSGDVDRMDPRTLLLNAATKSLPVSELINPTGTLTGGRAFWTLAGLGLLFASGWRRRGAALRFSLDTIVFMGLALGPFLRVDGGTIGGMGPYYGLFLSIPSFEQLKQPFRYGLLAACVAPIPIALLLDGVLRLLKLHATRVRQSIAVAVTAAFALAIVVVELRVFGATGGVRVVDLREIKQDHELAVRLDRSLWRGFPAPDVLEELDGGVAWFLPEVQPPYEAQYLPAAQVGLKMVNYAPYGSVAGGNQLPLSERFHLLSTAAWLSGTDRPRRISRVERAVEDRGALSAAGLDWIVVQRSLLDGPELVPALEAFLDANLERVADDGDVAVWSLAPKERSR